MMRHRKKRLFKGNGVLKINTDMDTTPDIKKDDNKTQKTNIEELKKQLSKLDIRDNKVKTKKKFIRF